MDDRDHTIQRVADRILIAADGETQDLELESVVSGSITTFLRAKLGPQAVPLLVLYQKLFEISEGAPVPENGFVDALRSQVRVITRLLNLRVGDVKAPPVANLIHDRIYDVLPQLRRIENGAQSSVLFRAVGAALAAAIAALGKVLGKGIFQRPSHGAAKWPILRLMNPDQEQVERLREQNPGLYAEIAERRDEVHLRERRNLENISREGLIPMKQRILGKMVTVGEDPATKERVVYSLDGTVQSVAAYTADARARDAANKASGKVFPNGLPTKDRPKLSLEGIRSLTDAQLEDPVVIPAGQEIGYAALTDDKTAAAGTRIYPVKRDIRGRQVIVGGRFKGVYLDDVVNHAGRLLEGTVYDFDKQGKRVPFQSKKADGSVNVSAFKEPYVTVATDGRFLLKLPFLHGSDWTTSRQRIRKLSGFIPTIKYEEGTDNTTYTFEEKDFAAVRSAVGGMCLSRAAADKLEAHFETIARQERALSQKALQSYSLDRIGGFKVTSKIDPATGAPYDPPVMGPDLFEKQKQAISWTESQGYKGVVALDTGVGKTLTAIAMMMKMVRDGVADDTGRFLYVCPANLRGNIVKEIRRVLTEPQDLLSRLDVMSYAEFRNRRMGGGSGAKKFVADPTFGMNPPYTAVFFDEAQELVKNEASTNSLAAQTLNHPRKILLTASPMEDDPDQLYVGVAIANNIDLSPGKRGQPMSQARKDLLRFRDRFCRRVGGRTFGLKRSSDKDPTVETDFKAWAKQGMFFAHKKDVIEKPIPELRRHAATITMDPAVEALYRRSTTDIAKIFRALVTVYRDKENIPGAELRAQVGGFQMRLAKHLELLSKLANMPGTLKGADGALLFPRAESPKIEAAANLLEGSLFQGGRALLFTDDPKFAEYTARTLSLRFPVMYHAVALSSAVIFYQDGKVVSKYGKKKYKTPEGADVPDSQWATHVLTYMVSANPQVVTCTLTKSYSTGQNLQAFSTVVHLDRDTFSSETMKQRTARAWRTGQTSMVEEHTLDTVYSNPVDNKDATLDEIRKYIQEMQEDVFDEIVGQSQAAAIGTEWAEMGRVDASFLAVNRHLLEVTVAPYVGLLADHEYEADLAMDPDFNDYAVERQHGALEHMLDTTAPPPDLDGDLIDV